MVEHVLISGKLDEECINALRNNQRLDVTYKPDCNRKELFEQIGKTIPKMPFHSSKRNARRVPGARRLPRGGPWTPPDPPRGAREIPASVSRRPGTSRTLLEASQSLQKASSGLPRRLLRPPGHCFRATAGCYSRRRNHENEEGPKRTQLKTLMVASTLQEALPEEGPAECAKRLNPPHPFRGRWAC